MIHLAIIEDNEDYRTFLIQLFQHTNGFSCQHAYSDMETALEDLPNYPYLNIIVVDIELPSMSGIEGLPLLRAIMPSTDFVILTIRQGNKEIFAALKAGASGYLTKHASPVDLIKSIEELKNGGAPMSPDIARKVIQSFQKKRIVSPLTPREKEVLQQLAEGNNYRAIAELLYIAPTTVQSHLRNIYKKLHVNTAVQAVIKALKDDLLD